MGFSSTWTWNISGLRFDWVDELIQLVGNQVSSSHRRLEWNDGKWDALNSGIISSSDPFICIRWLKLVSVKRDVAYFQDRWNFLKFLRKDQSSWFSRKLDQKIKISLNPARKWPVFQPNWQRKYHLIGHKSFANVDWNFFESQEMESIKPSVNMADFPTNLVHLRTKRFQNDWNGPLPKWKRLRSNKLLEEITTTSSWSKINKDHH